MTDKDTNLTPKKQKVSKILEKHPETVKLGRPSTFTQEVADKICARISNGESLRTICSGEDMPDKSTVMRWLEKEDAQFFRDQYARAREDQADFYAEQIVEIADEEVTMIKRSKHSGGDDDGTEQEVVFDPTAVARNRLRVDARKWYASKLAPKKYGDKVENVLTGPNGGPVQIAEIRRVVVDVKPQ